MSDLPYSTQALFYSSRAMHIRGQSERGARSMANELASTYIAVVKERDFLRAERDALKARVAELVDTQNVLRGRRLRWRRPGQHRERALRRVRS